MRYCAILIFFILLIQGCNPPKNEAITFWDGLKQIKVADFEDEGENVILESMNATLSKTSDWSSNGSSSLKLMMSHDEERSGVELTFDSLCFELQIISLSSTLSRSPLNLILFYFIPIYFNDIFI